MAPKDILEPQALQKIKEINSADILVGIPSLGNVRTVKGVVEAAAKGIKKYFPDLKTVLVNADGNSQDSTPEIVSKTPLPKGMAKIVTRYLGAKGKGSALRTIFEIADYLGVKMCFILDADTRSITPEWIKALGNPIYNYSYGYVTPYYLRDKHDATITNSLVYPLTRALYGMRVRQPIGGDFGLTGGLVRALSHQRVWDFDTDVNRFGIDIWMTTTAINEGFRTCQAALGVKVHDPKKPGKDTALMFKEVVGTLFGLMRKYEMKWKITKVTQPAKIFGKFHFMELEEIKISLFDLFERFKKGQVVFKKLWKEILAKENYSKLLRLNSFKLDDFQFPVDLWAKIVYDYACAYNFSARDRGEILESLLPLYFGRTAAFVIETQTVSEELADAVVGGIAAIFERLKPHLLTRWEKTKKKFLKEAPPRAREGKVFPELL